MTPAIVRTIQRADPRDIARLGAFGVATVHEAQDRDGAAGDTAGARDRPHAGTQQTAAALRFVNGRDAGGAEAADRL